MPKELDQLSIKHTVQRKIEACYLKQDLRRHKIDPELALKRANKYEAQRRQDLDQVFERFNASRARRRHSEIKEVAIKPKQDPRRTTRVREFTPAPPRDPFSEFCQNVRFSKKSSESPSIYVRPPPEEKAPKSPRPKRGKNRKAQPAEEKPVITGAPSRTHQLFVNKSMLMRDGVIDLDNADFMDYIIEKVNESD